MQNPSIAVRYRLVGQNRENQLMYEDITIEKEKVYFSATALEIMQNPGLLSGFLPKEAALIGYMVGTLSEGEMWQG